MISRAVSAAFVIEAVVEIDFPEVRRCHLRMYVVRSGTTKEADDARVVRRPLAAETS